MNHYVALLRGINVGGHKKILMKDLKTMLEKLGCKNIKTVLASGNAVFESKKNVTQLKQNIEEGIESTFGFTVAIQVIDLDTIRNALSPDPFKDISPEKGVKHYVTFLKTAIQLSDLPKQDNVELIGIKNKLLFSVIDTNKAKTVDFMACLDKNFGKEVTTRTINTIKKIIN